MNKINRKLEYALMALKFMSTRNPGELSSANEISSHLSTPYDVTARVMQSLANGGLLKVEYGAGGGYLIHKDLSRVTLLDLIEILEGPTKIARCLQKAEGCDIQDSCNIMTPMNQLNKKLNHFYQSISLKELLETGRKSMN